MKSQASPAAAGDASSGGRAAELLTSVIGGDAAKAILRQLNTRLAFTP
jgi:hypothetical protein